jgi:hypothetical protein
MIREIQGGNVNESAVKPMNHHEQSPIGNGRYVKLRACGNAIASADR